MKKYSFPKIPKEAFTVPLRKVNKVQRMRAKALFPMIDTFPHGVPAGGFGAGTIGRIPQGDFSIWHLIPGRHLYENVPACQFSVRQKIKREDKIYANVLTTNKPAGQALSGWKWEYPAHEASYSALYPKAWTKYQSKSMPVELQCTQFSPVLPHNYKETSYPVAVFKWNAYNPTEKVVEVSVMLTWQNMLGWSSQETKGTPTAQWKKIFSKKSQNTKVESGEYKGVVLSTLEDAQDPDALKGEFCIAAQQVLGSKVYIQTIFDCESTGEYLWSEFHEKGIIKDFPNSEIAAKGAAIIIKFTLGPKDSFEFPMVLAWDLPRAAGFERYYTKYLGRNGRNSFKLAKRALIQYKEWEKQIDLWHQSLLKKNRPGWYKRLLINELYYLADGGTIWDLQTERLAYLESYDYLFYDTLDVRFFGSMPLALYWPQLEKSIIKGFAESIFFSDSTLVNYNRSMDILDKKVKGSKAEDAIFQGMRKIKGACPHDLGSPFEALFRKTNAYLWQNANRWKDLNSKFVLQVYRIYVLDGRIDKKFLKETWPAVKEAINYLEEMDIDKDHLPENENFPDQTFDNWTMKGTSAYCGILRIASLIAASTIAEILGERDFAKQYRIWSKTAQESLYKKLWNGNYFDFDEKTSDLMSAQLAGHWYLDLFDLRSFIPKENILSIFKNIYNINFKKFAKSKLGVVNGRTRLGKPVAADQGNDVWLGINFMLASHMLHYGQKRKAWQILKTIHDGIYTRGFYFRTPESWDENNGFISQMYMRAGSIWAVECVLDKIADKKS